MSEVKRYPRLDDEDNSEMAIIMAMPDTPLPEDDDTVPFLIKGDELTEEVKPQITMDVLPPEVQAFIKEQILAAVAQTAAMLSVQPILSDIKDQLDQTNKAIKIIESKINNIDQGINKFTSTELKTKQKSNSIWQVSLFNEL